MANIRGLKDVSKDSEPDEKEEKDKNNTYYAGGAGGGGSGVNVQAPNANKKEPANAADIVGHVFDSAKSHGAISKSDEAAPEKRKFGGVGATLQGEKVDAEPEAEGIPRVVLTFYRDAFTIDDSQPRLYGDPANQAFLDEVNKGRVPREIQERFGEDVDVELIDKKGEQWKETPKQFKAFAAQGHSLSSSSHTSSARLVIPKQATIDASSPTTSIRVTLHDGSKIVVKLNHSHTVADLRAHIEATKPCGKPFELRTLAPPGLLENDTLNLKEANLLNSAIAQRLA